MKKIKLILINLAVLVFLILSIELFYILNKNYKFSSQVQTERAVFTKNDLIISKYKINTNDFSKINWPYPSLESVKNNSIFDLDYSNRRGSHFDALRLIFFDATGVVKIKTTDEVLYNVKYEYNFDAQHNNSFRKSDFASKKASEFILNIGDSFLFGEGVEQALTLPSLLNKKLNYNNYNFGVPGDGPSDQYYRIMQNFDHRYTMVKEKSGLLLYHYLHFHIDRVVCTLACYTPGTIYRTEKPEYKLKNNMLQLENVHYYDNTIRHFLFKILIKSEALNFFNYHFTNFKSDDFVLLLKLINSVFLNFENKLNIKAKYIVIHPGAVKSDVEKIKEAAKQFNINVLDYSSVDYKSLIGEKALIPIDTHPAAAYNSLMAQMISADLAELKK